MSLLQLLGDVDSDCRGVSATFFCSADWSVRYTGAQPII